MEITKEEFAGVKMLVKALLVHTAIVFELNCQKLWQTTTILFDHIACLRLQGIFGYTLKQSALLVT